MREKVHKIEEYLWTFLIFLFILAVISIPDLIYYHLRPYWTATTNPLGMLCTFVSKKGFSYTGSLQTLKNNFSILVTAMSVIITMCVNNLNRSEIRIFGLRRSEFDFSKRMLIYKYGRRMVFFAPLVMIVAVNIGFSMLGYGTLMWCYLFIIFSYFFLESSFSRDKDLDCIVRKLRQSVEENAQDQEDIAEYQMLLNMMRQWNDKEHYWKGANYLFWEICDQSRKDDCEKMYILCYCFYEAMYMRKDEANYDRAVYALKEYIKRRDRQGWAENDYLVLWGMLHCLLTYSDRDNVLLFVKWYLDFPARSRKLERRYGQENNGASNRRLSSQVIRLQTGVLLIEMELYFNSPNGENIDGYILKMLSHIWAEGKYILDDTNRKLCQAYLETNALFDLGTDETDIRLQNLCSDYQYGTTKSMTAYYLKYN